MTACSSQLSQSDTLASSSASSTSASCNSDSAGAAGTAVSAGDALSASDVGSSELSSVNEEEAARSELLKQQLADSAAAQRISANRQQGIELQINRDIREIFVHGSKPASCQKYIVLHDTEGGGTGSGVIKWWAESGYSNAAHFVVGKDGSVWQCVEMDCIAHHAGYGDAGHNELYAVLDESRDDKLGAVSIGDWAPDYGMNSYSIGIELIHMGDEAYPVAQLEALDTLIAYIDLYYGFESEIIDHKMWRSNNTDTSSAFAAYLANYRDHRSYL